MTNTETLTAFATWLQSLDVQLLGEDVNIPALIARYEDERLDSIEVVDRDEVSVVRHMFCQWCSLDVEVWLDDPKLEARDRGNNAHCPDGKRHDPLLDSEDWALRLHLVGDDED